MKMKKCQESKISEKQMLDFMHQLDTRLLVKGQFYFVIKIPLKPPAIFSLGQVYLFVTYRISYQGSSKSRYFIK